MSESSPPLFAQIKLHKYFGGGEVFARQLADAASALGGESILVVHPEARHWQQFYLPATTIVEASSWKEAVARLPAGVPLIVHAAPPEELAQRLAAERPLIGFVHMPLNHFYAETRAAYRHCLRIVGVSHYVMDTIRAVGLEPWGEPFYGIADTKRLLRGEEERQPITARSEFEWDRRKVRDYLLGATEPFWSKLRPSKQFSRRNGLTLGIVSRLAPIKQFPLLMELLVPHLARYDDVFLEIFGAGGYASVRDLRRAIRPLGDRVRFWGHQRDVAAIYAQIDVLLTGLPEREALGLNVIEAQGCGVPVLAPAGPPFDETVLPGKTGWLYMDPRGREPVDSVSMDFPGALHTIVWMQRNGNMPEPRNERQHMEQFSSDAFAARLSRLLGGIN